MEIVSLSQEPNQVMDVSRDGHDYEITLMTYANITLVSVSVDGERVTSSLPAVRGGWLIPYGYLLKDGGNFRFEGLSEDYPKYDEFGSLFHLAYYPREEFDATRRIEEKGE